MLYYIIILEKLKKAPTCIPFSVTDMHFICFHVSLFIVQKVQCNLLNNAECIPSDCITFHCKTLGWKDCNAIVQLWECCNFAV